MKKQWHTLSECCAELRNITEQAKFRMSRKKPQIRIVAGFAAVAERKEILVEGACNHPNCLVLLFRLELIRLAA